MDATNGEAGPDGASSGAPPLPPPPGAGSWTPRMPVSSVRPSGTVLDPVWGGALATPWRRLAGYLIDGLVLLVPTFVLLVAYIGNNAAFADLLETRNPTADQVQRVANGLWPAVLLLVLAQGVYYVLFIHLRGQTPGKMAVGVRVVQIEDGGRPSWGRAGIRWGVPTAASLLPGAGGLAVLLVYLWMLWDPKRQGLHDKAARTVVVRTRPA
jgi:uncharacterized RDD family membrane protein YckC